MPSSRPSSEKANPFPTSRKKEWKLAAEQELGNGNSIEKLIHSVEGIRIQPYYDLSDRPSQLSVQLPPAKSPWGDVRFWSNTARIIVHNASEANETALRLLNHGADGIFFELRGKLDVRRLLNGIALPYCTIFFSASADNLTLPKEFREVVNELNYDPESISGAIFWNQLPKKNLPSLHWPSFRTSGILSKPEISATNELAKLGSQTIRLIDLALDAGTPIHAALHNIAFSLSTSSDFFLEIVKFRALRSVWQRIAQSYSPVNHVPTFIHNSVSAQTTKEYEPHSEMISNTTMAISAILGSCDAITLDQTIHSSTEGRIALNVSSILREEAHLNKVADPVAGAYFIESFSEQLARESWKKMQVLLTHTEE